MFALFNPYLSLSSLAISHRFYTTLMKNINFPLALLLIIAFLHLNCGGFDMPTWDANSYADGYSEQMLIAPSNAGGYIGKKITVIGTVKSTFYSETEAGRPTFINLDKAFPDNPLTIILFEKDVNAIGFNRFKYENKQVIVTGFVDQFKDEFGKIRPSIHITNLDQIRVK